MVNQHGGSTADQNTQRSMEAFRGSQVQRAAPIVILPSQSRLDKKHSVVDITNHSQYQTFVVVSRNKARRYNPARPDCQRR